jgi:hypothetical protein
MTRRPSRPRGRSFIDQALLDALSRAPLKSTTFRVLIQLAWQIFAFQEDRGQARSFTYSQLSILTGLARSKVAEAIGEAVHCRILLVESKGGRVPNAYAFGPVANWDISPRDPGTVNRPSKWDGLETQQSPHGGRFPTTLHKERRTRREEPVKNPASSNEDAVTALSKIDDEDGWMVLLAASPLPADTCRAIVVEAHRLFQEGELTGEQAAAYLRSRLLVDDQETVA